MQTRRERVRQSAIDEIKSIAWDIATEKGIEQVTVNGIARQMGMTPPAFYSYFKSRELLIQALIIDAYHSFHLSLTSARDSAPESDAVGRCYKLFMAYREWAVSNPNMFGIFAGRQVPGFDRQEPSIVEAAEDVYEVFRDLYRDAWQRGVFCLPELELEMTDEYAAQMERINKEWSLDLPLKVVSLICTTLTHIHGIISIELSGRFSVQANDAFRFYQFQILCILKRFGVDYTPPD